MCQTSSSYLRAKDSLNLRDKIFELHDAVRELQNRDSSPSLAPPNTEDGRLTSLETQVTVLRRAVGTLADAVSEEFDSLKSENTLACTGGMPNLVESL